MELMCFPLSSKKLGDAGEGQLKNGYLYQGAFNELDEDINWNDFALRNYDPQIGRFVQQDPFDEYPNPYTGMGNDPVNLIDPSGGIGIPCPGTSQLGLFFMKAGEVISNSSRLISLLDIGAGVANGATGIYNKTVQFNIINQQFVGNLTEQVGNGGGGGDPIVEISEGIKSFWNNAFMPAVRLTNTYVNPLTPIVELATGKSVESDFTQAKPRGQSAVEAAIIMVPFGRVEGTAAKILEKTMVKDAEKVVVKSAVKAEANLTEAQLKSISSFEKQIAEHELKLAKYIKDPMKYDNTGVLKNAANDEIRQKIIRGRVKKLNHEIQVFKDNIQKVINGK